MESKGLEAKCDKETWENIKGELIGQEEQEYKLKKKLAECDVCDYFRSYSNVPYCKYLGK